MKGFRKEYRLRTTYRHWVIGSAFFFVAGALGCAKVPPCTVSPIEIEETREDVKILEKDLGSAKERAKQLSDELAVVLEENYGVKIDDDPERNQVIFASVRNLAEFVRQNRAK